MSTPRPARDPVSQQVGLALRFLDRLRGLTPDEWAAVSRPADPDAYAVAVSWIRAALQGVLGEANHPTGGRQEFAARADRYLDELGLVEDRWTMAREAVRAVLVADLPAAELSVGMVYEPFEHLIRFEGLE